MSPNPSIIFQITLRTTSDGQIELMDHASQALARPEAEALQVQAFASFDAIRSYLKGRGFQGKHLHIRLSLLVSQSSEGS